MAIAALVSRKYVSVTAFQIPRNFLDSSQDHSDNDPRISRSNIHKAVVVITSVGGWKYMEFLE